MAAKILIFTPLKGVSRKKSFDQFIEWGRPFGIAGINNIHQKIYKPAIPWFDYSNNFLPHGHSKNRFWFTKYEFLGKEKEVYNAMRGNVDPIILNKDGLIKDGRYLYFAKAYINVITHYRNLKASSGTIGKALIFLEKSIRDNNNGKNDPSLINKYIFESANRNLAESYYAPGLKYDIAKDLEMMASMLQSGHNSTSFRFSNKGFQLIYKPFSFKSSIPNRPRYRAISRNIKSKPDNNLNLTNEKAAAVGSAYSKAICKYGKNSPVTFFASIIGLTLTTVSMRVSELIILSRDALYDQRKSKKNDKRTRLRISRPKINEHQDLPIPHKLSKLAHELFCNILSYSKDSNKAFKYYINKYGDDFNSIDQLYIPNRFKKYFKKEYLRPNEVNKILGTSPTSNTRLPFPQRIEHIKVHRFVDSPGDISKYVGINVRNNARYIKICDIERACKKIGVETKFPNDIDKTQYICTRICTHRYIRTKKAAPLIKITFSKGQKANKYIKTTDLYDFLLRQFKKIQFPHWPYSTKEKTTLLSDLLLVWFKGDPDKTRLKKYMWWCPVPMSACSINNWISTYQSGPPILFKELDIRLSNGNYVSLTIHKTRKYHHTEALLAGASEIYINKLAGRKSGRQSDHYDMRTPHEIISSSIETFDPDQIFNVTGPIEKEAPPKTKIVERKIFLYENAAPKQITDVGGCRTDWSLNPCEQYGDCMRCNKSVWSKGDKKRLPYIKELFEYSKKMIAIGEKKLENNSSSASIKRQLQQYKDTVTRCKKIFATEKNKSIKNGTIITFSAAKSAYSTSQLTNKLRNDNCQSYNERN